MTENPYPNLGFDPVPGVPDDVRGLRDTIDKAASAVTETGTTLGRLRNSDADVWKGQAGEAFRAHFDTTLSQDLGYAQSSLTRAVTVLDDWHQNLCAFRDTAKGLETEAATARKDLAKAQSALQQAEANPDLKPAKQGFTDPDALRSAQDRLNAASAQVDNATTAVDNAQGQLDSILKRAHDLHDQHDTMARKAAAGLEAAAKHLAPSRTHKGIWDSLCEAVNGVDDYLKAHEKQIHDVLSATSAACGLLALVTPPPADAIFGAVALIAGAGALGTDLAYSTNVQDLYNGHWNTGAALGLGMDTLGVVPGVGQVKEGVAAFRAAGDFGDAMKVFGQAAEAPGFVSNTLNRIPLPGDATVWLQDFGEPNLWKDGAGTAVNGIELLKRSASTGYGSANSVIDFS